MSKEWTSFNIRANGEITRGFLPWAQDPDRLPDTWTRVVDEENFVALVHEPYPELRPHHAIMWVYVRPEEDE